MKTLLIDPFAKTVTEVEYDGSLDAAYEMMGCEEVQLLWLNTFPVPSNNALYLDAEGLITGGPKAFFSIEGKIFVGKAITVKYDDEGENVNPDVTPQMLERLKLCWVEKVGIEKFVVSDFFKA